MTDAADPPQFPFDGSTLTSDRSEQPEQGAISVNGASLSLVDGQWKHVRHPHPPARVSMPEGDFEQGPVSVDGAWFALVEGEWTHVGFVTAPDRPGRRIPEGYVSVNGALIRDDSQRQTPIRPDRT